MTRGTIINIALCEDTRLSGRLEEKKSRSTLTHEHPEIFKTRVSLEVTSVLFAGEQFLRVPTSEKTKTNPLHRCRDKVEQTIHVLYCRSLSNANVSLLLIGIEGF